MNKKYVVFGLAAALAIIGVVYFGTGANQQASVAALGTIATPIGPITTNPNDPGWTKLCKDRKPHLQVLSPNGGETYQAGQQITVKWRSCNVPSMHNLIIETIDTVTNSNLMMASGIFHNTPMTDDNNGFHTETLILPSAQWITTNNIAFGKRFKISIKSDNQAAPYNFFVSDTSNNTFTINSSLQAKVEVSTSASNPAAGNVIVNQTSSTNDIELLKFRIKAIDSDITIKRIPVQVTTTGHNVSNIVNQLKLKKDTSVVSVVDGSSGKKISAGVITTTAGCTTSCGFIFSNLSNGSIMLIPAGTTSDFSVLVDAKAFTGSYSLGDTIKASFTNGDVLTSANFGALDQSGNSVIENSTYRIGSSIGNVQTFRQ